MLLSEHVYCVAVTFNMTEWVEQGICIQFSDKTEHSSVETIRMIQKAAAMGNWWLAASWQCAHSRITSHAVFFGETSNNPGDSLPYSPDLVPCNFWLFLKLKSPLKGNSFQIIDEIQENMTRQLMSMGELCEVLRCLLWRGPRHHCSMDNVSCIFFNKCPYFSYYMAAYCLDRPHICVRTLAWVARYIASY